jgi:hypothetical protein
MTNREIHIIRTINGFIHKSPHFFRKYKIILVPKERYVLVLTDAAHTYATCKNEWALETKIQNYLNHEAFCTPSSYSLTYPVIYTGLIGTTINPTNAIWIQPSYQPANKIFNLHGLS